MSILVTGAAGFIGYHVSRALCLRGEHVLGVDNINEYYDTGLKRARLRELEKLPTPEDRFDFHRADITDMAAMEDIIRHHAIDRVVHLAAQPGVRYSIENPFAYVQSNLTGHMVMLEICRHIKPRHFVYASSSSVYGANTHIPFSVQDVTDTPVSLYGATKKADELLTYSYSHLYGIPATGLRFFTVYGPWGRPDMAYFLFTKAIMEQKPITVFGEGKMRRDFTYIDDIVSGVLACLDTPPEKKDSTPSAIYNLGNHKSENLTDFIGVLENALGKKALINYAPMPAGDVRETFADISESAKAFGFAPATSITEGLPRFVQWYRSYTGT